MLLSCRTTIDDGRPTIVLNGELDLSTVPQLTDHIARTIERHPGVTVAVRIDGLLAADDVGLSALLVAAAQARRQAGHLVLRCRNQPLIDRLAELGLDRVIEVDTSTE